MKGISIALFIIAICVFSQTFPFSDVCTTKKKEAYNWKSVYCIDTSVIKYRQMISSTFFCIQNILYIYFVVAYLDNHFASVVIMH
jgi:hypothetical protein